MRRRALAVLAALAVCLAIPVAAHAQACCAAAGLVIPARLRLHEDYAVGMQVRARDVLGAFDPSGHYAGNQAGDAEWDLEQDLFAAARVFDKGQIALQVPFLETRRTVPGIGEWGGGIGDLTVAGRYDFLLAGESRVWPGIALLASGLAPTGTPPERAGGLLATGATGVGSVEATLGVDVEQVFGSFFGAANGWATWHAPRTAAGVHESFAPLFTFLLATGYAFADEVSVGAFLSGLYQGSNRDVHGVIPGSDQLLWTAGGALVAPCTDAWRVQGTASVDLPIARLGRNETAGVGASVSVLRVWL